MTPPTEAVHFVVPDSIDDPARVSGGNVCDRRVRDGLAQQGWTMRVSPVDIETPASVHRALSAVPDGGLVLVDGLVAATWKIERAKKRATVAVQLFSKASKATKQAIADEAERVAAFVEPDAADRDVRWT